MEDRDLAERCRANVAKVSERFRWSLVLGPLATFARNPGRRLTWPAPTPERQARSALS